MIREGGKDIEIVLVNGLEITIDSAKITDKARSIDLNIDISIANNTRNIPIFPKAHGEFGFEISFTLSAEQIAEAGLNGNDVHLFYVDTDGSSTNKGKIKPNADGSVTISIDRASHYVLSVDTNNDVTSTSSVNSTEALNTQSTVTSPPSNQRNDNNPSTGVMLGFIPLIITTGIILVSKKRKA
jgi:hypothetical protein